MGDEREKKTFMSWGLKTKEKLHLQYHLWLMETSYLCRLFSQDQ
jgi:hypothetical protein